MRTFIEGYDPDLLTDDKLSRRIMAWTLLHDFGTDAIADLLRKTGASTPVESVGKLQEILWPVWLTFQVGSDGEILAAMTRVCFVRFGVGRSGRRDGSRLFRTLPNDGSCTAWQVSVG